ncbi:MAG: hypothetical protein U0269_19685 [Polyangiales bacterium]
MVTKGRKPASAEGRQAVTAVIVRGTDAPLSSEDERLLAEAVRRGREVVSATESAVASYGQWLFANLFAGETQPVLDVDPDHPVWRGLIEAKGSHNTGIARGTLVATLRIAALDKRLADGAWSSLSYSHKVALLPLGEPKALRAAARHVLAASLSVRDAREYVGNLRSPEGAQLRLTPGAARGAIRRLATSFARPRYVQKLETQLGRLEGEEREATRAELDALIDHFERLRKKLR